MSSDGTFKNLAFISYSRRSEGALAARLQKELESYAIPPGMTCDRAILAEKKYVRPIFRDHTDLNLHTESWDAQLADELRRSRYLILLCSPALAASPNVDREVRAFLDAHGNDSTLILPVIVAGNITALDGPTACLPPALREHRAALVRRNLPMAADCRGPELMLKTAAWILGVEYAGLHRQFRYQQAKRRRTNAAAALVVVVALAILGWMIRDKGIENRELAVERDRQGSLAKTEQATAARKTYLAHIRQAARAVAQDQLPTARESLAACDAAQRDWEWYYLRGESQQDLFSVSVTGTVPVALCAAKNRLAVLTPTHEIKILSLIGYDELRQIATQFKKASVVAFSSEGKWIAAGSFDDSDGGEVAVWEAETGRQAWRAKTAGVLQLEFSRDQSRLFVSAPNYGAIQSFDAATGAEGPALPAGANPAGKFVLDDAADRVAALDYDGRNLMLFDASDGNPLWSIPISSVHHRIRFTDVDISDDGKYVLAATDGTGDAAFGDGVWLVDAATGQKRETLGEANGRALICRFSPHDSSLAIGRPDGTVEVFQYVPSVGKARLHKRYAPHEGTLGACEFRDDREILSTGTDGVVRSQITVYDAPPSHYRGHTGEVLGIIGVERRENAAGIVPEFVTWSSDGTARIWSTRKTTTARGRRPLTVNDAKRQHFIARYGRHEGVYVVQTTGGFGSGTELAGKVEARLDHEAWVPDVAFSRDGTRLVTGSLDRTAKVWKLSDGSLVRHLQGHAGEIRTVAVDSTAARAATGSVDTTVRLWNCDTGVTLHVLTGHAAPIMEVCFSSDGRLVASGDEQGVVCISGAADGVLRFSRKAHSERIEALCFSNDGRMLLTAAGDKSIQIWNTETGESTARAEAFGTVVDALFGPTDRRLFTIGDDGNLRIWDPAGLELVLEIPLALRQAFELTLLADDSTLLAADIGEPAVRLTAPGAYVPAATAAPASTANPAARPAANAAASAAANRTGPAVVAAVVPAASAATPVKPPDPPPPSGPKPPESKPAEPIPAGDALQPLRQALMDHPWHYHDHLFPPGDECRFRADGTWHRWGWNYWVTGPREIRIHYDRNNHDLQTAIVFSFSDDLKSFQGEFTDPRGKLHIIRGTRK